MQKLLLFLLLSITFNSFSQNIDLFVWAGQSNAQGRQGDATGYPVDVNNIDTSILFNWTVANGSNSNGWSTMEAQVGYFPLGHFGPEVSFSRQLFQAGYNPAIFKYTQTATSIFQHWQGPGDGGLYDNMITNLQTAITDLQNQGYTVTVRGLVWIQGESDSNSQAAATAYNNNLNNILTDFKTNVVNDPDLPIILGVDEQFFNETNHEQHEILNVHQDFALNDNDIKFTSMYGYPKADVTHLTPAGLISHGNDLFDSYQLLVSGQKPKENCTLSSDGTEVSYERASWGQSFTTDCSGYVSSVIFSAASELNENATFTLYNGADCSGTVLYSKILSEINMGDNIVDISNGLYLDKEHTYYFDIVSSSNAFWRINYSNTSNVFGLLRTFLNGSYCGRKFISFDMDFSVTLVDNVVCANNANIYPFSYNGNDYEVVKENKNWISSATCAVSRGGKLVEINDQAEQNAIFNELQNANITNSNTVAINGGGASYLWIGANDLATEGNWVWDGDNNGSTTQFWQGGTGGVPIGGLYNNWGNEPDNAGNIQDAGAIAITQWPLGSGSLGSAGQWNDVNDINTLYYIIEYEFGSFDTTIYESSCNAIDTGVVIDTITVFANEDTIVTTITTLLPSYSDTLNFTTCNEDSVGIEIEENTTILNCDSNITTIITLGNDCPNSIIDINNDRFKLHPNPTNRGINIEAKTKITEIQVYNILGKKIINVKHYKQNKYYIDLSKQEKGVYLVRINNAFVYKIVKE